MRQKISTEVRNRFLFFFFFKFHDNNDLDLVFANASKSKYVTINVTITDASDAQSRAARGSVLLAYIKGLRYVLPEIAKCLVLELEVYERFREIEFSIFRRVDE